MIQEIKGWLGISNSQDGSVKIPRERLDEVVQRFRDKKQEIHVIFNLNRDRGKKEMDAKSCQMFVNKVFTKWGFTKLQKDTKRKHTLVNGKRVDTTPFCLLELSDMDVYQHIRGQKGESKAQYSKVTLSTSVMPFDDVED
jgi:hypothetical protein